MRTRTKWNGAVPGCAIVSAMAILAGCGNSGSSTQGPKPVVLISINPTSVVRGSTATIHWSTTGATDCRASGDWYGARPVTGSEVLTTVNVGTMEYTLSCKGDGGTAETTAKLLSLRAVSPPNS